jgi:hypothetical protein
LNDLIASSKRINRQEIATREIKTTAYLQQFGDSLRSSSHPSLILDIQTLSRCDDNGGFAKLGVLEMIVHSVECLYATVLRLQK